MFTRREFVGAAVSLSAGAVRATPLPEPAARMSGILVSDGDGCLLALSETGRLTRTVRYRQPRQHGVDVSAVSPDGRTAAVVRRLPGRPGDPNHLTAYPLTDRPVPSPVTTPIQFVGAWSPDGSAVVGSHFSSGFTMIGEFYLRTVLIDLATGRSSDLGLPGRRESAGGFPESPYAVQDWSADGRWLLARRVGLADHPRPFVLVPAVGGDFRPLDLEPTQTWAAHVSPDSRRILTVRAEPGREQPEGAGRLIDFVVEVRPLLGGAATEVGRWAARDGDLGVGVSARWRADGRRLVVLAQRRSDQSGYGSMIRPTGELVTLDPDGGNRRVVRRWVGGAPVALLGWV